MAEPKTVIPEKRSGSHNPGGSKPRKVKDAALLTELEREERAFHERRKAERDNSKSLRIRILAPVYLDLLKLCEKFGREPAVQAELCVELGVRFFSNDNQPYGESRPLEHLPEARETIAMESGDSSLIPTRKRDRNAAGWMGEDAGLPVAQRAPWTSPEVATVPTEPPPEEAPVSEPAFPEAQAEEDIEVTVA